MRTAVVLAAAMFAAVAGGPARAADAPPVRKCVMYQVGDLKVQVVRNRAMLQGAVNGQPVRVLIDTGADRSLVYRARAEALHLPLTDLPGVRMGGAGGVSQAQAAYIGQLQLAGAAKSGFNMLVAGEGRTADFDILLGEDFFGKFDIEFDIPHGAVRLLQPRNCGEGDMAYWASAYNATPIVEDHNDHVGVNVSLNGARVRALLDSGAATSVATPRAASAARVKLEATGAKGRGLGALTLDQEVGVLDSFSIGQETIRNAKLRFSDLFGATTFDHTGSLIAKHADEEPEMLLGFDFLKSHRVLISRSRHMVYFTYEGGPVFDTPLRAPTAPSSAPTGAATTGPATAGAAPGETPSAGVPGPSKPL